MQKKAVTKSLNRNRFDFIMDMTKKHMYEWIPSCIENYRNSKKGFTVKSARELLNTDFVRDGAEFFLENKIYGRKLQYIYYKAITKKSIFACLFWKYGKINEVIG